MSKNIRVFEGDNHLLVIEWKEASISWIGGDYMGDVNRSKHWYEGVGKVVEKEKGCPVFFFKFITRKWNDAIPGPFAGEFFRCVDDPETLFLKILAHADQGPIDSYVMPEIDMSTL